MNEYVFVEILYQDIDEIECLQDTDFVPIKTVDEMEINEDGMVDEYYRMCGRISSQDASFIALQYPELHSKMKISYISDDLKNKYRQ